MKTIDPAKWPIFPTGDLVAVESTRELPGEGRVVATGPKVSEAVASAIGDLVVFDIRDRRMITVGKREFTLIHESAVHAFLPG